MDENLKRTIFIAEVSKHFYNTRLQFLSQLLEQYNAGDPPEVRFLNSELYRLIKSEEQFYKFMKTFPGPVPHLSDAKFFHDVIAGRVDF